MPDQNDENAGQEFATSPMASLFHYRRATAHFFEVDWADTAIGIPEQWPALLRHALQTIVDSPSPIFIVWGPRLAFLYNAAYTSLLQTRRTPSMGQPIEAVWPELWAGVRPFIEAARAGQATFKENVPRDIRDGAEVTRRWFNLSYSPIVQHDASIPGVMCVITETTSRVQLERRQALQLQLSDRLSRLTSIDAIADVTTAMLGEYMGAEHAFFAEVDSLAGRFSVRKDWARGDALHLVGMTGTLNDFGPEVTDALRRGQPLVAHDVATHPLTAPYAEAYVRLGFRSLICLPRVVDGQLVHSLTIYHKEPRIWRSAEVDLAADIAERTWIAVERVTAAELLLAADRRKDEFLAMLAHELRNPLAPISAAAELLRRVPDDLTQVTNASEVIARQVRHMSGLIDDLLDVSRVTRGLVTLAFETVDANLAVRDALEQVRSLIESRRHQLRVELAPQSAWIRADSKRAVQIVANLLHNAAKYTPSGGQLAVSVDASPREVAVRVRDNGIGISPSLLPSIFEPFSQADRSVDRSAGGLGLGLALVKKLVELHGGKVTVRSDTDGSGSEFVVSFPAVAMPSSTIVPSAGAAGLHAREPAGKRLLIVDDNRDAADTLALFLETAGHLPSVFYGPTTALEAVQREAFDAFLVDVGLPGLSGYELVPLLRKATGSQVTGENAPARCTPPRYIAISGYGQDSDRERALAAGFDLYLIKPVDPMHLLQILDVR